MEKTINDFAHSSIEAKKLAEAHVNWLLETLKPILISQFVHGYKHGMEKANLEEN